MMSKQLLHLVFGGRISNSQFRTFENVENMDIVGIFPDYASAFTAWRGKSQATIDDAEVRYFIVHLHRLFDPSTDEHPLTLEKVFDFQIKRPANNANTPEIVERQN